MKLMSSDQSVSSVLTHGVYLALVHTLLQKLSESQAAPNHLFWQLLDLTSNILLLYKFNSECETDLLESFGGSRDIASLFVLSRVFYDHAMTLITRN